MIAMVETLLRLDGEEITKSERLEAKTRLPELQKELEVLAEESIKKKELKKKEGIELSIDNIRSYLNKLTDKTYDSLLANILKEITGLFEACSHDTSDVSCTTHKGVNS